MAFPPFPLREDVPPRIAPGENSVKPSDDASPADSLLLYLVFNTSDAIKFVKNRKRLLDTEDGEQKQKRAIGVEEPIEPLKYLYLVETMEIDDTLAHALVTDAPDLEGIYFYGTQQFITVNFIFELFVYHPNPKMRQQALRYFPRWFDPSSGAAHENLLIGRSIHRVVQKMYPHIQFAEEFCRDIDLAHQLNMPETIESCLKSACDLRSSSVDAQSQHHPFVVQNFEHNPYYIEDLIHAYAALHCLLLPFTPDAAGIIARRAATAFRWLHPLILKLFEDITKDYPSKALLVMSLTKLCVSNANSERDQNSLYSECVLYDSQFAESLGKLILQITSDEKIADAIVKMSSCEDLSYYFFPPFLSKEGYMHSIFHGFYDNNAIFRLITFPPPKVPDEAEATAQNARAAMLGFAPGLRAKPKNPYFSPLMVSLFEPRKAIHLAVNPLLRHTLASQDQLDNPDAHKALLLRYDFVCRYILSLIHEFMKLRLRDLFIKIADERQYAHKEHFFYRYGGQQSLTFTFEDMQRMKDQFDSSMAQNIVRAFSLILDKFGSLPFSMVHSRFFYNLCRFIGVTSTATFRFVVFENQFVQRLVRTLFNEWKIFVEYEQELLKNEKYVALAKTLDTSSEDAGPRAFAFSMSFGEKKKILGLSGNPVSKNLFYAPFIYHLFDRFSDEQIQDSSAVKAQLRSVDPPVEGTTLMRNARSDYRAEVTGCVSRFIATIMLTIDILEMLVDPQLYRQHGTRKLQKAGEDAAAPAAEMTSMMDIARAVFNYDDVVKRASSSSSSMKRNKNSIIDIKTPFSPACVSSTGSFIICMNDDDKTALNLCLALIHLIPNLHTDSVRSGGHSLPFNSMGLPGDQWAQAEIGFDAPWLGPGISIREPIAVFHVINNLSRIELVSELADLWSRYHCLTVGNPIEEVTEHMADAFPIHCGVASVKKKNKNQKPSFEEIQHFKFLTYLLKYYPHDIFAVVSKRFAHHPKHHPQALMEKFEKDYELECRLFEKQMEEASNANNNNNNNAAPNNNGNARAPFIAAGGGGGLFGNNNNPNINNTILSHYMQRQDLLRETASIAQRPPSALESSFWSLRCCVVAFIGKDMVSVENEEKEGGKRRKRE